MRQWRRQPNTTSPNATHAVTYATKHLCRRLLATYVARYGYVLNGNLVFSATAWGRIEAGQWACAVTEAGCHPANVLRAARLLSRTYL